MFIKLVLKQFTREFRVRTWWYQIRRGLHRQLGRSNQLGEGRSALIASRKSCPLLRHRPPCLTTLYLLQYGHIRRAKTITLKCILFLTRLEWIPFAFLLKINTKLVKKIDRRLGGRKSLTYFDTVKLIAGCHNVRNFFSVTYSKEIGLY